MNEQKILENFGIKFKLYRTKLKMTQDDVVNITNFSKSYISNVENGKCNLSLINALTFCKVINKNIEEMIGDI